MCVRSGDVLPINSRHILAIYFRHMLYYEQEQRNQPALQHRLQQQGAAACQQVRGGGGGGGKGAKGRKTGQGLLRSNSYCSLSLATSLPETSERSSFSLRQLV